MKRLILLTNQYPYDRGDVGFVASEIDALASRFDEIDVFAYSADVADHVVAMPENVTFRGNLHARGRRRDLLWLLVPTVAWRFASMVWWDIRLRRFWRRELDSVRTAVASVRRAYDPRLRAALARSEDTTVYSFWGMGGGMAVPALPPVGCGIAVRLHRFDVYDDERPLPVRGALYARADALLPVSDHAARYLRAEFGPLVAGKILVSRLGTVDQGLRPRSGSGPFLLVSCSSLTPVKRVDRILACAAELARHQEVRWVHFGDGPLKESLRVSAAATDSPHGLTVELRGQVTNDEVHRFYRENHVDAFVNLSSSEGVPVSIMEALSHDVPVVATDVGGTSEIVSWDAGSGVTVDVDASPASVVRALLGVRAATDLTPRRVWEERCDADVLSASTADLLVGGVRSRP
tara:strand:- start:5796 stop:7013 length:1218 start_codon:yes stop_codon:yes gene_type:complete